MSEPDSGSGVATGTRGGMALELDALRRFIALELVATGAQISGDDRARVSAAILDEAVRISVEWVEAELTY